MIRWLVSLLPTAGPGVAPTEGTPPGVMATYQSGPMGADPAMQDMPASYNDAYGEGNEFADANVIGEAVNDTYPE